MGSSAPHRLLLAAAFLVGGAGAAAQKPVLLQIRPMPGDTLQMRLDQEMIMTGTTRLGEHDSTRSVATRTFVRARVIVERSEPGWTTVLAITDSVTVAYRRGRPPFVESEPSGFQGTRLRMRISPEGVAQITENPDGLPAQLHALFASLPATLPSAPVAVGETWSRDVAVPPGAAGAAREGTVLRSVMRLDSLSREGRIAYISLTGTFTRDSTRTDDLPEGATLSSNGIMTGAMRIDRVRGWLTESSATITVNSMLRPPPGSADKPMKFHVKITQQIRAIEKP